MKSAIEMNETHNQNNEMRIIVISLFGGLFLVIFLLIGTYNSQVGSFIAVISAFFIILVFIPGIIYLIFRHSLKLIDYYILSIPYTKITDNQFYCKVCKSEVEAPDEYCSNCGMLL